MRRKKRMWIAVGAAVLLAAAATALLAPDAETPLERDVKSLAAKYGLEQYDQSAQTYATNALTLAENKRLVKEFEALKTKHGLENLGGYEMFPGVDDWNYSWTYHQTYDEITQWSRAIVTINATDGGMTSLVIDVERVGVVERISYWFRDTFHRP